MAAAKAAAGHMTAPTTAPMGLRECRRRADHQGGSSCDYF